MFGFKFHDKDGEHIIIVDCEEEVVLDIARDALHDVMHDFGHFSKGRLTGWTAERIVQAFHNNGHASARIVTMVDVTLY